MKQCDDYEIELSALLDGESDPKMALMLVQHVASCRSCSAFVHDLRSTQTAVDRACPVPEQQFQAEPISIRRPRLGFVPRWSWGLAAACVITLVLWFGSGTLPSRQLASDMRDGELVIRLEEHKGHMTNERFVALMSELLRADRMYQNQMYEVLDELKQNEVSGESGFLNTLSESENFDESHWGDPASYSPRVLK